MPHREGEAAASPDPRQPVLPAAPRRRRRLPGRRRPKALAALLGLAALATACSAGASAGPATTIGATTTTVRRTTTTSATTTSTSTTTAAPTTTASVTGDAGGGDGTETTAPQPFATTTAIAVAQPGGASQPFAAFDATLSESLFDRGALTVSVAVAKDGKLVHEQAFGAANPFTGTPATVDDRFRIASVSKTLLAVALLELVEAGRLGLDEPVGAAMAAKLGVTLGDPAAAAITVRQLMAHTSGYPEYQRTFFGGTSPTCKDAAARGLSRGLLGPPGTVYQYSNLNYCLLGLLVEDRTGVSYERLVKDSVLAPLGIDDMRVVGTYETGPGDVLHPTTAGRVFMEALGAAGNWVGTASDLVTVVDSLDPAKPGQHLLAPTVINEMLLKAPVVYPHQDSWYGLGLIVWDAGQSWGHTGTIENARSMVLHRADGVTWAVLVNGGNFRETVQLRTYVDKALATVTAWPT